MFEAREKVLHSNGSVAIVSLGGCRRITLSAGGGMSADRITDLSPLQRIGAALEALVWAYLGGWAARYFASGHPPVAAAVRLTASTPAGPATEPGGIPVSIP